MTPIYQRDERTITSNLEATRSPYDGKWRVWRRISGQWHTVGAAPKLSDALAQARETEEEAA